MSQLDKYFAAFLIALAVTYVLTPLVRGLAARFGVVDLPGERRAHQYPTARGGGLAVALGVQAACVLVLVLFVPQPADGLDWKWWRSFTLASSVLVVLGLIDDIRGLGPWPKLAGQIAAALLITASGTHFGKLFGYALPPLLDSAMAVIWIVALINAFNLIDGLDGLASGLAIIAATGLCGIFIFAKVPGHMIVLIALLGACLAFLRYNLHPATIFLGDTGSMFIGFTLGVISLQTFTKSTFILSLTIPMLVLGVPIYDALLAVWRRSVRLWLTKGQPSGQQRKGLMSPDMEHLHHRLLKAGLSTRRVATLLCILNAGFVLCGLLITMFQSHASGIFLLALLAAVFLLMRHLAVIELRDTGRALLMGLRRPTHATFKALLYPVWDMVCLSGAVALAMWFFEGVRVDFWHTWFLELPVWVTPTFSLLAMSRTYLTVWTRARVLDVLMLASTLVLGLLLSLGIALLIDPAQRTQWIMRALVVGGLAHPAMLGLRVLYRSVEELVLYLRSKSESATGGQRVALYGAGGRCQLFLKERGFNNSGSFDGRVIVGLIDDEPSLHAQFVYGYLVLGSAKNLPHLISQHHLTGIIITATLSPEALAAVQEITSQHGLLLTEWHFGERELKPQASSAPQAIQAA